MSENQISIQRLKSKDQLNLDEQIKKQNQQLDLLTQDKFNDNILKEDYNLQQVLSETEQTLLEQNNKGFFRILDNFTYTLVNIKLKILGKDYKSQNDFYYSQKKKILDYLFQKNQSDSQKQLNKIKSEKNIYYDFNLTNYDQAKIMEEIKDLEKQDQLKILQNYIHSIEMRQKYLENSKFNNRGFFLQEMHQAFWNAKTLGNIWGFTVGNIILVSFMHRASAFKQMAMLITCFHIGGQMFTYRCIDRVFDPLYTYFYQDMKKNQKNQLFHNDDDIIDTNLISQEEIERIMDETKERKQQQLQMKQMNKQQK